MAIEKTHVTIGQNFTITAMFNGYQYFLFRSKCPLLLSGFESRTLDVLLNIDRIRIVRKRDSIEALLCHDNGGREERGGGGGRTVA